MRQEILKYIVAVGDHWFFWFGGIVLVVFEVAKRIPRWKKNMEEFPSRWFWIFASACLLISMFQAWKEENEHAEALSIQNEGLKTKVSDLTAQLIAKDRPLVIQAAPDPEIHRLLEKYEQELVGLKAQFPWPKKKALQLSTEMLKFVEEVTRNQPILPVHGPKTQQESQADFAAFTTRMQQWLAGVSADYQRKFSTRIVSLQDDLKSTGIDASEIGGCESSNGNLYFIQSCAARVGAVASRISK